MALNGEVLLGVGYHSCLSWVLFLLYVVETYFTVNHKNYNFLDCDWFKKLLFSTNSLAKLLSDSMLLDSLLLDIQ